MFRSYQKLISLLLVVITIFSPAWVYAQQGAAARATQVDVSYVTPGAVLAAVAHPQRVLKSPDMEMLPIEVISAAGKQYVGIDPLDIVQLIAVVEPPTQGPPEFGIVAILAKPYRIEALILPPNWPLANAQLDGRPYRQSQNPMLPGLYMPNDQTLMVATDGLLRKMLENKKSPKEGPLSRILSKTSAVRRCDGTAGPRAGAPMLAAQLDQAPLPPQLESVKRLPALIDAVKLELTMAATPGASAVLLAPTEPAAVDLEKILNQLLDMGQQMALAQDVGGNAGRRSGAAGRGSVFPADDEADDRDAPAAAHRQDAARRAGRRVSERPGGHHRHPGGAAAARRASRAGGGPPHVLREQSEADRVWPCTTTTTRTRLFRRGPASARTASRS